MSIPHGLQTLQHDAYTAVCRAFYAQESLGCECIAMNRRLCRAAPCSLRRPCAFACVLSTWLPCVPNELTMPCQMARARHRALTRRATQLPPSARVSGDQEDVLTKLRDVWNISNQMHSVRSTPPGPTTRGSDGRRQQCHFAIR